MERNLRKERVGLVVSNKMDKSIYDSNGDGIVDLLTGAGPGGGPQVNGYSFPALDLLFSFYSGNPNNGGGVFV